MAPRLLKFVPALVLALPLAAGETGQTAPITRGLGLGKGRPSYQPGEQWSDLVKTAAGEPAEVQLDLVLFEDGTHWGPNKSNRLERLLVTALTGCGKRMSRR